MQKACCDDITHSPILPRVNEPGDNDITFATHASHVLHLQDYNFNGGNDVMFNDGFSGIINGLVGININIRCRPAGT